MPFTDDVSMHKKITLNFDFIENFTYEIFIKCDNFTPESTYMIVLVE